MDEKFLHELAFLRENLNSITTAVSDVKESIHGDVDTHHRASELFVGSGRIVGGSPAVCDLTQRHSIGAPSTFESSSIRVVDNDAPVHIAVSDINLACGVIHKEFSRPSEDARVLVVHWIV